MGAPKKIGLEISSGERACDSCLDGYFQIILHMVTAAVIIRLLKVILHGHKLSYLLLTSVPHNLKIGSLHALHR